MNSPDKSTEQDQIKRIKTRILAKAMLAEVLKEDFSNYDRICEFFNLLVESGDNPRMYEMGHVLICSTPPNPDSMPFDYDDHRSILKFLERMYIEVRQKRSMSINNSFDASPQLEEVSIG